MVMFEVDDLDARMSELGRAQVRTVWSGDTRRFAAGTFTPATSAGRSSASTRPSPLGSWLWGGPAWTAHTDNTVVTSIAGYTIAADDPAAVTSLWSLFGLLHCVRFVEGTKSEIELTATDRGNLGATGRTRPGQSCDWCDA